MTNLKGKTENHISDPPGATSFSMFSQAQLRPDVVWRLLWKGLRAGPVKHWFFLGRPKQAESATSDDSVAFLGGRGQDAA